MTLLQTFLQFLSAFQCRNGFDRFRFNQCFSKSRRFWIAILVEGIKAVFMGENEIEKAIINISILAFSNYQDSDGKNETDILKICYALKTENVTEKEREREREREGDLDARNQASISGKKLVSISEKVTIAVLFRS